MTLDAEQEEITGTPEEEASVDGEQEQRQSVCDMLGEYKYQRLEELYYSELVLMEEARALVANRMENTSFVQVSPREKYNLTDTVIDELTGNVVVSESVKAALRATAEQKAAAEILESAALGAADAIPDYVDSVIEGAISDVIGGDLFSAVTFIQNWINVDNTPRIVLQGMVDDQRKAVAQLDAFLSEEVITAADIAAIAQTIYAIDIREFGIGTATESAYYIQSYDYSRLRQISKELSAIKGQESFYMSLNPETVTEMTQSEMELLGGKRKEYADIVAEYSPLMELETGNIAINYDVEGFLKAQENVSREGILDGLLGSVLGGIIAESGQGVEDDIQTQRVGLYRNLYQNVQESFLELSIRQMSFLEDYAYMKCISEAEDMDCYFAKAAMEDAEAREKVEADISEMVSQVAKYWFDLSVDEFLLDCLLTQEQAGFLVEMSLELDSLVNCISLYDPSYTAGYTMEECQERYRQNIEMYVEGMEYVQVRGAALGSTPGFYHGTEKTVYGNGEYVSYNNGSYITEIIRLGIGQHLYSGKGRFYYYDRNGNLIWLFRGNGG